MSWMKSNREKNYKLEAVKEIRNTVNDFEEKEPYISNVISKIRITLGRLEEKLSNE